VNAKIDNRRETVAQDSSALTDSRLAARCAETAQQAFFDYQTRFDAITRRARERFLALIGPAVSMTRRSACIFNNDVLDSLTGRIRN